MADVGKELMDVPFPQLVKRLALGIAQAQLELDMKSVQIAQLMAGQKLEITDPKDSKKVIRTIEPQKIRFGSYKDGTKTKPAEFSLLELGFTPSFYQFVDTIIEVKMSVSMTQESSFSYSRTSVDAEASGSVGFFSASASMSVTTVSASFASKYQYHAEGSSLLRTKLVPVPPPSILEERIRLLMANNGVYPDEVKPS